MNIGLSMIGQGGSLRIAGWALDVSGVPFTETVGHPRSIRSSSTSDSHSLARGPLRSLFLSPLHHHLRLFPLFFGLSFVLALVRSEAVSFALSRCRVEGVERADSGVVTWR